MFRRTIARSAAISLVCCANSGEVALSAVFFGFCAGNSQATDGAQAVIMSLSWSL